MSKRRLVVQPAPHLPEAMAAWIWALQDTRTRTKQLVEDLNQIHLDYLPDGFSNSIGTLLYHLAATEISWLYEDVLGKEGQQLPADLQQHFAPGFWVSEQDRRLVPIMGKPLAEHLHLLDYVRDLLLKSYQNMSLEDFRCPRSYEPYEVTPEWVLYHLTRHEAGHQGQMLLIRRLYAQQEG